MSTVARHTAQSPPSEPVVDLDALRDRVGRYLFRQRRGIQEYAAAQKVGQGRTWLHPENILFFRPLLNVILKCTGLYSIGRRNAHAMRLRECRVRLPRLPEAFIGYRLLHLSDLHLDIDPTITDALIEHLEGVDADACVITGDFRAETWGDYGPALRETARLMPHLRGPVYAVLGNHDFLEMVPDFEAMGMRMLMNENVAIRRGGQTLYLVGIDDPHFYETDNLEKATAGIPYDAATILLAHTAECYRQALAYGIDFMLSGHTHGGQICLPGGIQLIHNAHHPRMMDRGYWQHHALRGYTSSGVGACMVPVRFFCPPEIMVHTLDREPGNPIRDRRGPGAVSDGTE